MKKKNDRREKDVFLIPASLLLVAKGALIQQRGSRLPKTVNVSWDHIDLKRQLFDKSKPYHATVEKLKLSGVKLVYKSGEMVRFIPGPNIPFKVKAYKESHIMLLFCIFFHMRI